MPDLAIDYEISLRPELIVDTHAHGGVDWLLLPTSASQHASGTRSSESAFNPRPKRMPMRTPLANRDGGMCSLRSMLDPASSTP
jgi:hypothetical protein